LVPMIGAAGARDDWGPMGRGTDRLVLWPDCVRVGAAQRITNGGRCDSKGGATSACRRMRSFQTDRPGGATQSR